MTEILFHISDTHHGVRGGLVAPGTFLSYDNGDTSEIQLSDFSRWLWHDVYVQMIDELIWYAQGRPVVINHTGDLLHGGRFSEYLYSPYQHHQLEIAELALAELRRIPNVSFVMLQHGTAAHDYGQAEGTKRAGEILAGWGYTVKVASHASYSVSGVNIDASHHGPSVSKAIDRHGAARRHTISYVRSYLERGEQAPSVILRGHVHKPLLDTVLVPWGRDGEGRDAVLSIAPPLCGQNEYARKVTRSEPRTACGGVMMALDSGRVIDKRLFVRERSERVTFDIGVNKISKIHTGKYSN